MPPPGTDPLLVAARLAYVCRDQQGIRVTLQTTDTTPLDDLLDAARNRRPDDIPAALHTLHHALRAAGDAKGIYGHVRSFTAAGVEAIEFVHRCPLALCDGREDSSTAPICSVTGAALVRERLA